MQHIWVQNNQAKQFFFQLQKGVWGTSLSFGFLIKCCTFARKAVPWHSTHCPWSPVTPQGRKSEFCLSSSWLPAVLQEPSCFDGKITASLTEQNGSLQNLICESIHQLNAKIDKLQGALSTGESKLETMSVKIIQTVGWEIWRTKCRQHDPYWELV